MKPSTQLKSSNTISHKFYFGEAINKMSDDNLVPYEDYIEQYKALTRPGVNKVKP